MIDQTIFGLLAGIIALLAFIPYIFTTLKGKTRPNKATWIIWAVLGIIIAASYYSAGARETVWVPIVYSVGMVITALVSLKYGQDGWTALDKGCLAGAGIGIIFWAMTSDPATAYYITTTVDAIGAIPTISKAWKNPGSEDKATWLMFLAANSLNLLAIGQWTPMVAFYPIYVFVLCIVMCTLILRPGTSGTKRRSSIGPARRL